MRRPIILFFIAGLATTLVQAQNFIEVDLLDLKAVEPTASNGSFGQRLALAGQGKTVLVAAPDWTDDQDPGSQDGGVFSFSLQANGTLLFEQALKPSSRFRFGLILAASGDWAAVGESGDKVHLYLRSGSSWLPSQLLRINTDVPSVAGITVRNLASAAAMDGNLLAIGDKTANVVVGDNTLSNAGAVVLFRRAANGSWLHEATLIAPDPVSSSAFGEAVAVSGNTLLVGAPDDSPPGGGLGGAYVFERQGGSWKAVRTLRNPDTAQNSAFGWSVALDGDLAIVGCATCLDTEDGPSNTGSFFSFERNLTGNNQWGLRGEFASPQPVFIDQFTYSMHLQDQALLVGSRNANRAELFLRNAGGGWSHLQTLTPSSGSSPYFGSAVVLSGGHAVVGASRWPNTTFSERWGAVSAWFSETVERCGGALDGIFCDRFESHSQD
jgi:hypothetical protein